MNLLLIALAVIGADLYRAPTGELPTVTEPADVWVYFTDKGFVTEDHSALALTHYARPMDPKAIERRLQTMGTPYDFDDLPPFERYVGRVQDLGGQLRTRSAWLNAASFRMTPEVVARVAREPFVHRMKIVGARWEPTREATYALASDRELKKYRASDTIGYKEIYGLALAQNLQLGVPPVYLRGVTGSGVRVGILDTGLKRRHSAVKGLRIAGEHDFLSGDRFFIAPADQPDLKAEIPIAHDMGLIGDLTTFRQNDTLYLCYTADSAVFESPVRALYCAISFDNGGTWNEPLPIFVADRYNPTIHRPTLCGKNGYVYVCFQTTSRAEDNPNILSGYFHDAAWQGATQLQFGGWPDLYLKGDSIYLTSVDRDSAVWFACAAIAGGAPVWQIEGAKLWFSELVRDPGVVVDDAGRIYLYATGWRSGKIHLYRSDDAGETFDELVSPVIIGASRTRLHYTGGSFYLIYQDYLKQPLAGLSLQRSTDAVTWTKSVIAESLFSIGGLDLRPGGEFSIAYEIGGKLYTSKSLDAGATWSRPESLGTFEFSYQPRWLDDARLLWVENGDSNTDVEDADSLRFGRNQADHGTRMASIIAGFHKGALVGVAPGAELLIAKNEYHSFRRSGVGYEFLLEEDNYIEALEWAERHGADIVSSSLGYTGWYLPENYDGKTAPISVAAGRAAQRGMMVVTAMGNRDTTQPDNLWPGPYIVTPGDADHVITVGGIEKDSTPWHTRGGGGTGVGPRADGVHKPDIVAMGDSVTVVAPDSENVYELSSGTSGATALIAGCCALLKEAHPDWTGPMIRDTMFKYAARPAVTESTWRDTFGWGIPNVNTILELYPPVISKLGGDELGPPFPNPLIAGGGAEVCFPIYLTAPASFASLTIFTLNGEIVDTITLKGVRKPGSSGYLASPGRYSDKDYLKQIGAVWNGKNVKGKDCASGTYYAVLLTGNGRSVRSFAIVR